MGVFLITTGCSMPFLRQKVENKGAFLNLLGLDYSWHNTGEEGVTLCISPRRVPFTRQQLKIAGDFLASVVAPIIISHFRDLILRDLIKDNYFYFNQEEQLQIADLARRNFQKGIYCHCQQAVGAVIENRIREYLFLEGRYLNLEGFMNFRLQYFQDELKKAVEVAVESYLMKKKYQELARVLRYLLELEEPKIDLLHLLVDKKGWIQVTDKQFREVDPCREKDFSTGSPGGCIDTEDLLISMLASMAPSRVLVHQNVLPRYPKLVDTIKRIFNQRAVFCPGCKYCSREPLYLVNRER